MYATGFYILFLGAPFESNTSLHLAEIRATYPEKKTIRQGAPVMVNGKREWVEFDELDYDSDDFETITNSYLQAGNKHSTIKIGNADCWLFPMAAMVDYGIQWIEQNRA
jgi:aminoglycoside 3-N-acetyltransferase